MQFPSCCFLIATAPLLEEERDIITSADFVEPFHPFFLHKSGARAGLAADNSPVDTAQVNFTNWSDQGFERNEQSSALDRP